MFPAPAWQVDELYEAYCIQRRLQDGASKMKQAFGASPASRAARESLAEVHRSYKEYTEVGPPPRPQDTAQPPRPRLLPRQMGPPPRRPCFSLSFFPFF